MTDKILVTGATGFVGGRLAEMLVESGRDVRLLVRQPQALRPSLQDCELSVGDLADPEALHQAVTGVSLIFHCAANVSTWDSRENYLAVNVDGLRHLLDQVIAVNPDLKRFVHFSTVDVYDYPASPCDESCELAEARFGYGESKRQAELLLMDYGKKYDLSYTILRPCNVIGPGSQFVERIGAELKAGLMLRVDGGRANAGPVFVDNLARYAVWAAEEEHAKGEVFNVRDPYDITWAQFLADLKSGINGRGLLIDLPYWLANAVAVTLGGLYSMLRIRAEPLLHPLVVKMFGRTCGHSAAKLHALCPHADYIDYPTAMQRSCDWFNKK